MDGELIGIAGWRIDWATNQSNFFENLTKI
jgi:hypothetical protein